MASPSFSVDFVYFDLDDTLLDHYHAQEEALRDTYDAFDVLRSFSLDHVREVYHHINVRLWKSYAAGTIGKEELNVRRFSETLSTLGVNEPDPLDFRDFYLSAYADHWKYLPGALEIYTAVAKSCRVGILTNGFVEIQKEKFGRFPDLTALSSATLISEEVGVMKPHPDLFRKAAELAKTPPEKILYVGDSYSSDVRGGLAAGWHVAWFHRHPPEVRVPRHVLGFTDWSVLAKALGLDV